MFGTVARIKTKPGKADQVRAHFANGTPKAKGQKAVVVYQADADPDTLFVVVAFDSRESYQANAHDPEQGKRFEQVMALLAAEPEWNDGNIIYASM